MWHVLPQVAFMQFVRRLNLEGPISNAWFLKTILLIVVLVATIGFHTSDVPSRRRILAWVSRPQMTPLGRQ
jgi:peptidoglycan/LPS O-acetylase OafA/YrhL